MQGNLHAEHTNRYLNHKIVKNSSHGLIRSGNSPDNNQKEDVILSNLTYKFSSNEPGRYHPIVEKSRDKNLNLMSNDSGRFNKFGDNLFSTGNTNYYMLEDTEESLTDTTYFTLRPGNSKKSSAYKKTVDTRNLKSIPDVAKAPLSQKLDIVNNKLIKTQDII